jgi:hypothetical protein
MGRCRTYNASAGQRSCKVAAGEATVAGQQWDGMAGLQSGGTVVLQCGSIRRGQCKAAVQYSCQVSGIATQAVNLRMAGQCGGVVRQQCQTTAR